MRLVAKCRAVLTVCLAAIVSGCAIFDSRPPEEIVAERAQERVELLRAGEYDAAYAYATPGYRSTETVARYGTRWSGVKMWLSADVTNTRCEYDDEGFTDSCKAFLEVTYIAAGHGEQTTLLEEPWILIDSRWYLYQRLAD